MQIFRTRMHTNIKEWGIFHKKRYIFQQRNDRKKWYWYKVQRRALIRWSYGINPIILRISYVYVTYILRIWYVIDSGKIKVSHYFHIKKCVDTTNMGGRTYPVRYYPVAIRLRDRRVRQQGRIDCWPRQHWGDLCLRSPQKSADFRGPHNVLRHSMYCAISSEWGLFGRNTRSAFRRTPSRNWQRKSKCIV